jgi:hypothetical protein
MWHGLGRVRLSPGINAAAEPLGMEMPDSHRSATIWGLGGGPAVGLLPAGFTTSPTAPGITELGDSVPPRSVVDEVVGGTAACCRWHGEPPTDGVDVQETELAANIDDGGQGGWAGVTGRKREGHSGEFPWAGVDGPEATEGVEAREAGPAEGVVGREDRGGGCGGVSAGCGQTSLNVRRRGERKRVEDGSLGAEVACINGECTGVSDGVPLSQRRLGGGCGPGAAEEEVVVVQA